MIEKLLYWMKVQSLTNGHESIRPNYLSYVWFLMTKTRVGDWNEAETVFWEMVQEYLSGNLNDKPSTRKRNRRDDYHFGYQSHNRVVLLVHRRRERHHVDVLSVHATRGARESAAVLGLCVGVGEPTRGTLSTRRSLLPIFA